MSSENETTGLKAIFILEIIGRPAEHLTKTLNKIIDDLGNEKGVKVTSRDVKNPIEMEDQKDFYTTFAEINIEVEEVSQIAGLMFKYMPANVEIVEPELIALTNNGWNEILNELTRRLHGYDEVSRVLQMKNAQMQRKLKELSPSEGESVSEEVKETLEEPEKESNEII
jgi:hypothetical protein